MAPKIPFNRPYLSGRELAYAAEAFSLGHTAGNGVFTKRCHGFFADAYGMKNCLLTQSCTAALEMSALLVNIKPGDEVIMPSFTFVSTANAFVLRGAKIRFADSSAGHPNLDVSALEALVTKRTKAIVPVHYGGVACEMDEILVLAKSHGIHVIEDAAQAVDAFYRSRPLGTLGDLGTLSFHETKNIISGEGGMLVVNDPTLRDRAGIIWEKGTNRNAFFRGEVAKYEWVDVGSSYLPSELTASFLCAQLENLPAIQSRRSAHWNHYIQRLGELAGVVQLPAIPPYATHNSHIFYLVCRSLDERIALLRQLRDNNIEAVFHYQSLHKSKFFQGCHDERALPEADRYSDCLLRLPLYVDLTPEDVDRVCDVITAFYR